MDHWDFSPALPRQIGSGLSGRCDWTEVMVYNSFGFWFSPCSMSVARRIAAREVSGSVVK